MFSLQQQSSLKFLLKTMLIVTWYGYLSRFPCEISERADLYRRGVAGLLFLRRICYYIMLLVTSDNKFSYAVTNALVSINLNGCRFYIWRG